MDGVIFGPTTQQQHFQNASEGVVEMLLLNHPTQCAQKTYKTPSIVMKRRVSMREAKLGSSPNPKRWFNTLNEPWEL